MLDELDFISTLKTLVGRGLYNTLLSFLVVDRILHSEEEYLENRPDSSVRAVLVNVLGLSYQWMRWGSPEQEAFFFHICQIFISVCVPLAEFLSLHV